MLHKSTSVINARISDLKQQIEKLESEKNDAEIREKQYALLTSPALQPFIQGNVDRMEDFMLADKCRETSLFELFSILGKALNFCPSIPVGLSGKSIAHVLYVLDYIADDKACEDLPLNENMAELNGDGTPPLMPAG